MKTFFNTMKKKKNAIPDEKLIIFQDIINTYGGIKVDNKFMEAIGEQFAQDERFRLFSQNGGCRGMGSEKARKAFAIQHADKPLAARLDLYIQEFENNLTHKTRSVVLDEKENIITFKFGCHECYKHSLTGKLASPFTLHYERCADGRMQNLE